MFSGLKFLCLLLCFIGGITPVLAQFPLKNFQSPNLEEALAMESYAADPQAKAVYLYDINQSEFLEAERGFSILYSRRLRIKVFSVEGSDVGVVRIPFKGRLFGNPISNLTGGTYFRDGEGKVQFVPLEDVNISDAKLVGLQRERIVVFPQVKPGAVLELSYDYFTEDIGNMPSFHVQEDIPKVMTQYYSEIPMFYAFRMVNYGNMKFETFDSYPLDKVETFGTLYNFQRLLVNMVAKEVPAFEEEPFMPSPYITKGAIDFLYVKLNLPDRQNMHNVSTWRDYNEWLLASEDWRGAYGKERIVKSRMPEALLRKPSLASAQDIYYWVKENYGWNGDYGVFPSQKTREFTGQQAGNIADINLTLLNALRAAGFEAYPLVSSLSYFGSSLTSDSPLVNIIQNLVVELVVEDEVYYLNAAVPYLPFGTLLPYGYNGLAARIDDRKHGLVTLGENLSAIFNYEAEVQWNEKSAAWESHWTVTRQDMALGVPLTKDWLTDTWNLEEVAWTGAANSKYALDTVPVPFTGTYPVEKSGDQWLIPRLVDQRWMENPFVAEVRIHNIQFDYPCEHNYRITVHLPEGYRLAEIPEAKTVALPQRKGLYYYAVSTNVEEQTVMIQCSLRLNDARLAKSYYPYVKSLFQEMAANHRDYLVLEKVPEE